MRGLKVVCMLLIAVLIYNIYTGSQSDRQAAQVVKILDNHVADQKVTAICVKDGERLKAGDICEVFFGEDTTIRRLDGSVSYQKDLQIGEVVKLQYASRSLKYQNNKKKYFINRVAFILKEDNGLRQESDLTESEPAHLSFGR